MDAARPAPDSLQARTLLCGGGYWHHAEATMPLSVKSFRGGTAHYQTARGRYAVDEQSWLIINDQEPYVIDFNSPTPIRSTVVFFPTDWAGLVARLFREREERLLDTPDQVGARVEFLQTVMPADDAVLPLLRQLDDAGRGKILPEPWLEERLRELLAAMLLSQDDHRARAGRLPATRAATREEVYRRLCRGRDFLGAEALRMPRLSEAAAAATMSPYHFQRRFKEAFGETPHAFATRRRLEEARRLLSSDLPATEVALTIGYESYGAFHRAFRRRFGVAPGEIRKI